MLGKSVLLCSSHTGEARRVRACLCAAGNDVIRVDSAEAGLALILAGAVDLAVVDHQEWVETHALIEAARGRVPVVAIVDDGDPHTIVDLVCNHQVHNLVSRRPRVDPRELVVTAEKILRGDAFGLGKYLTAFGVELLERDIAGAADRDEAVEAVQHAARELGASRNQCAAVGTIADELITNAVYNAPRFSDGSPRYAARDRSDKVELEPHERPRIAYGSDGATFGIAVTDPFGALTGDDLQRALRRCLTAEDPIEQKAGGAGLGMYIVARSCRQLVINVEPGRQTEVIALIDLGRAADAHSLHVFVAPAAEQAAPIEPVALSDTLKLDLRSTFDRGGRRAMPLVKPKLAEVRAITAEEPRLACGDLLPPMEPGTGLGTALAALRGARDADSVLETALRFLGARFGGAVLFDVTEDALAPRCASGELFAWSELLETRVARESRGTLAALARGPGVYRGPLARASEDEPLLELLAGDVDAEGGVITIAGRGGVTHLLCGFDPLPDERFAPTELQQLADEISAKIDRLGRPRRERLATVDLHPSRITAGTITTH